MIMFFLQFGYMEPSTYEKQVCTERLLLVADSPCAAFPLLFLCLSTKLKMWWETASCLMPEALNLVAKMFVVGVVRCLMAVAYEAVQGLYFLVFFYNVGYSDIQKTPSAPPL